MVFDCGTSNKQWGLDFGEFKPVICQWFACGTGCRCGCVPSHSLHFLLGWARRTRLRISGRNFIDDFCNAAISFYAQAIGIREELLLQELLPLTRLINGKLKGNRLSGICYRAEEEHGSPESTLAMAHKSTANYNKNLSCTIKAKEEREKMTQK